MCIMGVDESKKKPESQTIPFNAKGFDTGMLLLISSARKHAADVHGKGIRRDCIVSAIRRGNLYTERMEKTGFHVIHHDDFDEWLEGR